MRTKTLLASMALASLAVAQPLSAATRSSESLPVRGVQSVDSSMSVDRAGSVTGESEELSRAFLLIILLFGGVAALILALSGNKSEG